MTRAIQSRNRKGAGQGCTRSLTVAALNDFHVICFDV